MSLGFTQKWLGTPLPPHHGELYVGNISAVTDPILIKFKARFLGSSITDANCHGDICPGNIFPCQEYFTCCWPDFNKTLKKKILPKYRVHGNQDDWLELIVSRQKSILKNMNWVPDINQNVPKYRSPYHTCIFWDVFANISGFNAYFYKPTFALKPWIQAGRFE